MVADSRCQERNVHPASRILTENLNLLRFDHDSTYMDSAVSLFESASFRLKISDERSREGDLRLKGVHALILPSGYEKPRTNFSGDDYP
jgi:hypothetical protein